MTLLHTLLLAAALTAALLWPRAEAQACSREALTGISLPAALPVDNSVAPRNTNVWVATPIDLLFRVPPVAAEDVHIEVEGNVIEASVQSIAVAGESKSSPVWQLTPTEPFAEGATVEVVLLNTVVSTFRVSEAVDQEAPSRPSVASMDVRGEYFGALFCGEPSHVEVKVIDKEAILVLRDASQRDVSSAALAMGSGTRVRAIDLAVGKTDLVLTAIDLAGNQSEPLVLPVATVPPGVSGCSTTGRSSLLSSAWLLALVCLLRKRRVHARNLHHHTVGARSE